MAREYERFIAKARDNGSCWVWVGAKSDSGYGLFWVGGRFVQAHRWAVERVAGALPEWAEVDHMCTNRSCVRVDHLDIVTHVVNSMRQERARPKDFCVNGHPLKEFASQHANRPRTVRCRECQRIASAKHRAKAMVFFKPEHWEVD